jgi:hypothetical protein
VETKTNQIVEFGAPGLCSVLYSFQCELVKELSNNLLNCRATEYEKNRTNKILVTRMAEFGRPFMSFLAKTDAEQCLGAGMDKQTLGSQKVLELVISYLFDTSDGFEAIGKEYITAKEECQQKVTN